MVYIPTTFDNDVAVEATPLNHEQKSIVDPMNCGFYWYIPPLDAQKPHSTSGQEWVISGHDMQVLTMTVPQNEHVMTEVGTFMFGSSGIKTEAELICCKAGGCSRMCGGESCAKVILTNEDSNAGFVGLTPNYPAKIIPIQFGTHVQDGHALLAQRGAFMAQLGDVDVGCEGDFSLPTCCCAGFGCCRQKIEGPKDSVAFLAAGGTLVYKNLSDNETIVVDTRSVVAMEESVKLGITSNGRLGVCCLGGEGCCSTTLTGPGKVFMQSMSFPKFQGAVQTTVIDDRGSGGGGSPAGEAIGGAKLVGSIVSAIASS